MAEIVVEGDEVVVRISALEELGAFHGKVAVPLAAVEAVTVDHHPWGALRGMRAPGTGLPGVIALGPRLWSGGRDFAALYGHKPAVVVDLGSGSPFCRLVVSVADPHAAANAIRTARPGVGGAEDR